MAEFRRNDITNPRRYVSHSDDSLFPLTIANAMS